MKLLDHYQNAVNDNIIQNDLFQRDVIDKLQLVIEHISVPWLFRRANIRGLYIDGPVGVGKTFIMDLFYKYVPEKKKARFHFHHFMQYIDEQLRLLQGHKNPVNIIGKQISKQMKILCLDEFFVTNVANAMILADLLKTIFNKGVVIIATSNVKIDNLYYNGLHREMFLPAIDLLKKYCNSCSLIHDKDYRMGRQHLSTSYFTPLNPQNTTNFVNEFYKLAGDIKEDQKIIIQNREIEVKKTGSKAIWFAFDKICAMPRCALDYLEISEKYKTIFVSDVPVIKPDNTSTVTLFMHFVDVMYDRRIKIVLLAETSVEGLYTEGPMLNVFQRTISRLDEMQSY